jgi:hypothetical protein
MKFEYPNVLYALFALAIPIIIHLFNFRKYKTVYFSSLFFIKQVNEETKSTQKLKHLLVLLSRILAFICLIIAFAQPYLPIKNGTESGTNLMSIYIDNSFSMSLKGTDGELLSMAKEKAKEIIKKANDDSKFMIITNNFESIEQRLISKQNALERVDKVDYSPFKKDILQVLKWVKEGVSKESESIKVKQTILLSDFQKNNLKKVKNLNEENELVYPIQLKAQQTSNIAIDSLWFTNPNFKTGVNNELSIKIKNYGEDKIESVELLLTINEMKRTVFVDLNKNEEEIVKINFTDSKPGLKIGKIQISDKQMNFDDDFYFTYTVNEKSNVLIIDGDDAVKNIQIVYGLESYYNLQTTKQNTFVNENIQQKDIILLNGWNEFSSASISQLIDFVDGGGSLAIFPGSKPDFQSLNILLSKLSLPTFISTQSSSLKIKKLAYEDPFFKEMFDKKPAQLNLPSQTKYFSTNKTGNFLNLIELENNSPLFFKSQKPYNVFVFASSLNDEFGNFKANALFSSILLRMAEMSQKRYPFYLTIGNDANFPIHNDTKSESPIKLKSKELEFVPQTLKEKNTTFISIQEGILQANFKSGIFDVLKDEKIGAVALNYDRAESNVENFNEMEIKNHFQKLGIKNVFYSNFSNNSNASIVKIDKPVEYWRLFIIFALLFIVIEMALLKWLK